MLRSCNSGRATSPPSPAPVNGGSLNLSYRANPTPQQRYVYPVNPVNPANPRNIILPAPSVVGFGDCIPQLVEFLEISTRRAVETARLPHIVHPPSPPSPRTHQRATTIPHELTSQLLETNEKLPGHLFPILNYRNDPELCRISSLSHDRLLEEAPTSKPCFASLRVEVRAPPGAVHANGKLRRVLETLIMPSCRPETPSTMS